MRLFEQLPFGWVETSLGDICNLIQYGLNAKSGEETPDGVFFLRISDIEEDGNIVSQGGKYVSISKSELSKYRLIDGDLVIARSGSVGRSYVYHQTEKPWVFASYLIRFRPEHSVVLPDYLGFYMKSVFYWYYINTMARTVAQPNINSQELKALPVPLPPLSEQQEIVEMLREADTLRQLRQQAVQKTGDLFLSIFQSKFGDPVQNEKKWTKTTLSKTVADDCPITYGIVQPGTDTEDGVLLIRPVDLVGRVITSTHPLKRIEASIAEKYPRSMLRGGELLLSVRGQIGTLAFADESLVGGNVTRGIVPLWFRQEVLPEFIYAQLLYPSIQQLLQRMAVGIALRNED